VLLVPFGVPHLSLVRFAATRPRTPVARTLSLFREGLVETWSVTFAGAVVLSRRSDRFLAEGCFRLLTSVRLTLAREVKVIKLLEDRDV